MKTITNIIITHAAFILLFGLASLAFAQTDPSALEVSEEQPSIVGEPGDGYIDPPSEDSSTEETEPGFAEQSEERQVERANALEERQAATEERLEERGEAVAERQEARAEKRAGLEERAQERITNLAANMSNRIEAAIARVQNIIDRIETRIEKLEERGVDTTEATATLASAQISVDAASAAIRNIDADVAVAVGSEDARTAWTSVKATFTTVRDHLKTAHSELRATVGALKKAVAEFQETDGVSEAVRANQETETTE